MDILARLSDRNRWQAFLEYRIASGHLTPLEELHLRKQVESEAYLPIVERIRYGEPLSPPRRVAISKMHKAKKRIVYIYPPEESLVLKFLTHQLQRRYDHLFAPNLYSFRPHYSVRRAVDDLLRCPDIRQLWSYKVDICDYFNSVPVELLMPMVREALPEDGPLADFLERLLTDSSVLSEGKPMADAHKGIMAGTPISTFLANLYLAGLDWEFYHQHWLYARYSDDIILFAPTKEELDRRIALVHRTLAEQGLAINPEKESFSAPGEGWVFLGIRYCNRQVDIAPASLEKIKAKMRRKTRALARWKDRKGAPGPGTARAFIRAFNRKMFENSLEHDLTWARWYFPLLTTAESLREIDHYQQQCIRYLATGKHTKAAYNFRYEQMKALGYISLVNAFYSHSYGPESPETQENNG